MGKEKNASASSAQAKKEEKQQEKKDVDNVVNEIKERFGEGAIMTMREIHAVYCHGFSFGSWGNAKG